MNSSLTPEQRSGITFSNIDGSDCGVIAIQAITGKPRKEAEELAAAFGYRSGSGIMRGGIDTALRAVGYSVEPVKVRPGTTPATFTINNEYGVFLVYTEKHVMALVEGDLRNSRSFWRNPIEAVMKVDCRTTDGKALPNPKGAA
jgi:hypothetical protein